MRAVTVVAVIISVLFPEGTFAQDWKSPTGEQAARWDACYKETRLIHRTHNMSQEPYRAMIEEARKLHMQTCMARAISPRAIVSAEISERRTPSTIAAWSANP
ncbi:hypothetical protein [Microvirga sp. TS319]|uniref:hypothetical protein n=1 Tax=Microvirga sp. TS319 TaxID=3241165 RepID=UPI00351AA124